MSKSYQILLTGVILVPSISRHANQDFNKKIPAAFGGRDLFCNYGSARSCYDFEGVKGIACFEYNIGARIKNENWDFKSKNTILGI